VAQGKVVAANANEAAAATARRRAWARIVHDCALASGREENNLKAYTGNAVISRQLEALGVAALDELLRLCRRPTLDGAARSRVSRLLEAARAELRPTDNGSKAAMSAVNQVYGASKLPRAPKADPSSKGSGGGGGGAAALARLAAAVPGWCQRVLARLVRGDAAVRSIAWCGKRDVDDAAVRALAQALRQCRGRAGTLRTIDLRGTAVTDASVTKLEAVLPGCGSVTQVALGGTRVSAVRRTAVARLCLLNAVAQVAADDPSLGTQLNWSHGAADDDVVRALAGALPSNTHLRRLSLCGCVALSDDGAAALQSVLPRCPAIVHVDIGESFLREYWVAVPKALRARRVNNTPMWAQTATG
jgi:hypothetical protein